MKKMSVIVALVSGAVSLFAAIAHATGQTGPQTPSDLVRFLTEGRSAIRVPINAKRKHQIGDEAAMFSAFAAGPSRAVLLQLPDYHERYTMTITSHCNCFGLSKSVFVPSGLFFDADFNETTQLLETDFRHKAPAMSKGYRLEATVVVDDGRKGDRFLLLYTANNAVGRDAAKFVAADPGATGTVATMQLLHLNGVKRSAVGTIEVETK